MGTLDGRTAIVTGAGRGIGRGIAERFAREGAKVVVASRSKGTVDEVVERIISEGGVATRITVDVGERSQVERMVDQAIGTFGQVDILVNNAQSFGTRTSPSAAVSVIPLEDYPEDDWDFVFQTGVKASLYAMQAVFPGMRDRSWGRIVNFGSPAEHMAIALMSGYNSNKAAIRALTRTAAREWGKFGITVNVISPGIETDSVRAHFASMAGGDMAAGAKIHEKALQHKPIQSAGTPEDAGGLATFICSDDAAYITGMTFMLDGGSTPT